MSEHEIVVADKAEVAVPDGPVDMGRIMALAERGTDAETLGKMVDLYERVHSIQAEQAMNEAMRAFQDEMPLIERKGEIKYKGSGQPVRFAKLDDIVRAVGPLLSSLGLSYTWDTDTQQHGFIVTCTLRHIMGASRESRFVAPRDESGGKNPIQGIGSTLTYGQRYSLVQVLGLTLTDDNDGTVDAETLDDEQAANVLSLLQECSAADDKRIRNFFQTAYGSESIADIPAEAYARVIAMIEKKRK